MAHYKFLQLLATWQHLFAIDFEFLLRTSPEVFPVTGKHFIRVVF